MAYCYKQWRALILCRNGPWKQFSKHFRKKPHAKSSFSRQAEHFEVCRRLCRPFCSEIEIWSLVFYQTESILPLGGHEVEIHDFCPSRSRRCDDRWTWNFICRTWGPYLGYSAKISQNESNGSEYRAPWSRNFRDFDQKPLKARLDDNHFSKFAL